VDSQKGVFNSSEKKLTLDKKKEGKGKNFLLQFFSQKCEKKTL